MVPPLLQTEPILGRRAPRDPATCRSTEEAAVAVAVMIVAVHALVRCTLRATLERDSRVAVVGEAEDAVDALGCGCARRPEVVIVLAGHLTTTDLMALEDLHVGLGGPKIVLVLDAADGHDVVDALQAGVTAVLTRSSGVSDLSVAVQEARAGRRFLASDAAALLFDGLAAGESPRSEARRRLETLSARERQVLGLVIEGRTSSQIADTLGISTHTADTHRRRALGKLDIGDAASLFKFALRHGILRPTA